MSGSSADMLETEIRELIVDSLKLEDIAAESIDVDEPHIVDLAPTALRLFGIQPPSHMDGKPFAVAV